MNGAAASLRISLVAVWFVASVAAQELAITSVVNDATGESRLCPGARAHVFGSLRFGPSTTAATIAGRQAPVLGSTIEGALIVQIPAELTPGSASLVVEHNGVRSSAFALSLESIAPALYAETRLDVYPYSGVAAPGNIVQAQALCLGPTDPPFATGSSQRAPVVNPPAVTIAGQRAELIEAFHADLGLYLVRFRLPGSLPDGAQPLTIRVGGQDSNTRGLEVSNRPIIRRVFNAADFETEISPGSIVSIQAENLGATDQLTGFPALAFQGIGVTLNGIPAPLYHLVASAKQINIQIPTELPVNEIATVQVSSSLGPGTTWRIPIFPLAPGIFRVTYPPSEFWRNAAALIAGTAWRVMPSALARELGIPDDCSRLAVTDICGRPAAPGEFIEIYLTGLGTATPGGDPNARPIATGEIPPAGGNPLYWTTHVPGVFFERARGEVLFSGLAPGVAGLYQISVRIPENAPTGDQVSVAVSASEGDRGYVDYATLAIQR